MARDRSFKEQAEESKGSSGTRIWRKAAREEKKIIESEAAGAAATTES